MGGAQLRAAGAEVAASVKDLFARTDRVLLMLANGQVVDSVLGRGTPAFNGLVRDHLVVHMGTMAPAYSEALGRDVVRSVDSNRGSGAGVAGPHQGGAPGRHARRRRRRPGRGPEHGRADLCLRGAVRRRAVGPADETAVNLYLVTTVTGLVVVPLRPEQGLDLERFREVVDGGQMYGPISDQLGELRAEDFTVQAALGDVHYNASSSRRRPRGGMYATPLLTPARVVRGGRAARSRRRRHGRRPPGLGDEAPT